MATLRKILIVHVFICISEKILPKCAGFSSGDLFLKTPNIGELTPNSFDFVQEGSTLHLNCSLHPEYADANNVSAHDIVWNRGLANVNPQSRIEWMTLSNETDSRVKTSLADDYTATLRINDLMMGDDDIGDNGVYGCFVNVNGSKNRISTVEVPVAGPPRKYVNFSCVSENFHNLNCSFQRPGPFIGRSTTKYNLSYHVNGSAETQCPKMRNAQISHRDGLYWCEWDQKHGNSPLLLEYTHLITITGTNSYGTSQWHEDVSPSEHVRSKPVKNLTAVPSNHTPSCYLDWETPLDNENFLRTVGLVYQIDTKENHRDPDDVEFSGVDVWNSVADAVQDTNFTLNNLDAYTNYTIRIRSRPKKGGASYSDFTTTSCFTPAQKPGGGPGLVTGAYEELGNGGQRRVTLYWMGLPKHLHNGPDFRYQLTVRTLQGGRFIEGPNNNRHTEFANFVLSTPSTETYEVEIKTSNNKGDGLAERTVIPAVRDQPLLIQFANVVKFQQGVYELSWGVNRKPDTIDLFWCQTTLQPHLEKCTDRMEHVNVSGSLSAYNVSLDPRHEYRFAVSARQGEALSGMTWVVKSCSSTDRLPDLEGLTAVQGPKGSANISWLSPCQKRFLPISGYKVFYYPCEIDAPAECTPNKSIDTNLTTLTILSLSPGRRYCFSLFVLEELRMQNVTGFLPQKVVQCLKMAPAPSPPKLPMGKIVGGSVGASILLVVIVFIAWRCVKRARKDFQDIKQQSQKIIIPPGLSEKYDDHYRNHYTNVDSDHSGYMRQFSDVSRSSSGHGSITSRESRSSSRASKEDIDSISRQPKVSTSQSAGDLTQLHLRKKSSSPDTVSLTSSLASASSPHATKKPVPRPRVRPFSNTNTLDKSDTPSRKVSQADSEQNDSGVVASTGDSQLSPSDGYVTAIATIHMKSQSPKQRLLTTSDGGYVSQQSSVSDSAGNSGEDMPERSRLDESLSGVSYSSAFGHVSEENLEELSNDGLDSGQSSPSVTGMTKSYVMPEVEKKAVLAAAVPASGYVAWP